MTNFYNSYRTTLKKMLLWIKIKFPILQNPSISMVIPLNNTDSKGIFIQIVLFLLRLCAEEIDWLLSTKRNNRALLEDISTNKLNIYSINRRTSKIYSYVGFLIYKKTPLLPIWELKRKFAQWKKLFQYTLDKPDVS